VAEYIILSFLVRYALSYRLEGLRLTLFTALVTALYGVHDEMLQGLHPLRYHGWRDIIVNSVAGLSGAMLGHGLVCFDAQGTEKSTGSWKSVSAGQQLLFSALLDIPLPT
jgi:VanZ family protein